MTIDPTGLRTGRLGRFVTRAPLVISKHLWIGPLLGAVLISLVGLWTRSLVEGTMKAELAARLQTLLSADVAALRLWFTEQEADAKSFAADLRINEAIAQLVALSKATGVTREQLLESPAAQTLDLVLKPLLQAQNYVDYVVVGADRRILASPNRQQVSQAIPAEYEPFVRKALSGQATVSRPFVRRDSPNDPPDGPTMFVAAPVRMGADVVLAALGLRMKPEGDFSAIFSVGRMGESGEAYAFDRDGLMLTASRFDNELKELGLLTNSMAASSILTLRLFDPGEETHPGKAPPGTSRRQPKLTRMAEAATQGMDGYDAEGYRNYRGVKVIGAWAWLPDYALGVATEVAADEAFQTLYILRRVFLSLFLLLVLSGLAIFAFSFWLEHLQASMRRNALAARRLGQYVLVQEIGRGASGIVYRARHTLLRRPVAVKLLSPEMTDETNVERFEHEVQMTSQLTHPNTVAIYDYGRTPEGLFYYAMEYLSGIDLHRLVREFGPQPEGRVIHILQQVCGSLAEAHRIGLIHRDIKPANIVLTRRGGVCDLVKVLDFGMVKAVHLGPKGMPADTVVGTPHFMSPEAVEKPEAVDFRSDLYSVGAVGYWLLTGKTLFKSENVDALLAQQVGEEPPPISARLGNQGSVDLQALIMRCLHKQPERRPPSAEALDEALGRCAAADAWSLPQAEKWWRENISTAETVPSATMPEKTLVIAPRG